MGQTRVNSQDIFDGGIKQQDLGVLSGTGSLLTYNAGHVEFLSGTSGSILMVDPSNSTGLSWSNKPVITQAIDPNGNVSLNFLSVAGAVNYLSISNSADASPANVTVAAQGSSADINIRLVPKSGGKVRIGANDVVDTNSVQGLGNKALNNPTITGSNQYGPVTYNQQSNNINFNGAVYSNENEQTGLTYNITTGNYIVAYEGNYTGTVVWTLPSVATCSGQFLKISNNNTGISGVLLITGFGTDIIDVTTRYPLYSNESVDLISDGLKWDVLHAPFLNANNIRFFGQLAVPGNNKLNFYTTPSNGTALTTASLVTMRNYFLPFIVNFPLTVTGMAINVTTSGVPNDTGSIAARGGIHTWVKAAIYTDNGAGAPDKLWNSAYTNEIRTDTAGVKRVTFATPGEKIMNRGRYWLSLYGTGTTNPGVVRGFAVGGIQALGMDQSLTTTPYLGWTLPWITVSGTPPPAQLRPNFTGISGTPLPAIYVIGTY
jgi:hypothetical protein